MKEIQAVLLPGTCCVVDYRDGEQWEERHPIPVWHLSLVSMLGKGGLEMRNFEVVQTKAIVDLLVHLMVVTLELGEQE